MTNNRMPITEPDIFDILSAIWVMSCNDENPIVTYEGIRYRLRLASDFDVQGLVRSRPELFRPGVSLIRLKLWKENMLSGKSLPSWIREEENEATQREMILSLGTGDVFRSQFRAKLGSAQSSIATIEWGLHHIDRLRRANLEAHQEVAKSREVMWVLAVGILNVIVTVVTALSSN